MYSCFICNSAEVLIEKIESTEVLNMQYVTCIVYFIVYRARLKHYIHTQDYLCIYQLAY